MANILETDIEVGLRMNLENDFKKTHTMPPPHTHTHAPTPIHKYAPTHHTRAKQLIEILKPLLLDSIIQSLDFNKGVLILH